MTAGRHIISQSQSWCTPHKYVNAVKKVFNGTIDLDPCSNEYSIVHAKVEYMLPEHNGLIETWNYPRIYVNPPYGFNQLSKTSIKNWLLKCSDANLRFNAEVIALIPVATNTLHWKKCVFTRASAICFLADTRLKFLVQGTDNTKGAPMACAMVYWGDKIKNFKDVFIEFGAVVDIRDLIDHNAKDSLNNYQPPLF